MPLLEAHQLSRSHGRVEALRSASLSLEAGERVAVMGRSGCGKSTLLYLLGLLDTPTDGLLLFQGHDTSLLSDRQRSTLRGKHIGFVFQAFHLIPDLTLLQNVTLPLSYTKRDNDPVALLEQVGLSHRHHHYPGQLSGGELQRAAIARALVNSPSLLLADEPTGNLDQTTEQEILDLLLDLPSALLLVTHNLEVAKRCERVLHMEDGIL